MITAVHIVLAIHIGAMTPALLLSAAILWRRGLFRWTTAGFWAWAAFTLYYAANPFFALWNGDLYLYRQNLALSGGIGRGIWIVVVALAGVTAFFWAYLRTQPGQIRWRLSGDTFSWPMVVSTLPFVALGVYSLLTQRALVVDTGREKLIEGGRFIGQVTGYENAGYMFLVVPILLLVLARNRLASISGFVFAGLFVLLALPSGWSRFALVSMLLALSLAGTIQRKSIWPRWYYAPLILIFTLALQLRGHAAWKLSDVGSGLLELSSRSIGRVGDAVGSTEVSMLATWYVDSYVTEEYTGYNYGLPLANYLLTSWIPSRVLPQKYFLIDWLKRQGRGSDSAIERTLYGAKASLLGSFYRAGGLLGVILMAVGAGYLSRKLDGMLTPQSPLLVRATGVAWMSVLWMVWGSSDTWAVMALGILGLPALVLWYLAPKTGTRTEKSFISIPQPTPTGGHAGEQSARGQTTSYAAGEPLLALDLSHSRR